VPRGPRPESPGAPSPEPVAALIKRPSKGHRQLTSLAPLISFSSASLLSPAARGLPGAGLADDDPAQFAISLPHHLIQTAQSTSPIKSSGDGSLCVCESPAFELFTGLLVPESSRRPR